MLLLISLCVWTSVKLNLLITAIVNNNNNNNKGEEPHALVTQHGLLLHGKSNQPVTLHKKMLKNWKQALVKIKEKVFFKAYLWILKVYSNILNLTVLVIYYIHLELQKSPLRLCVLEKIKKEVKTQRGVTVTGFISLPKITKNSDKNIQTMVLFNAWSPRWWRTLTPKGWETNERDLVIAPAYGVGRVSGLLCGEGGLRQRLGVVSLSWQKPASQGC